mgnify:CR=1 FL=1|jgi:hypothetical protein
MAARNPRNKTTADSSNPEMPVATPSFGAADNWSMKALVDLNGSICRLENAITNLTEKVGDVRQDQQKQLDRIDKVERKLLVASAVIGVLLVIGGAIFSVAGFVGNKAIDFGMKMAEQRINSLSNQPAPTLPPASAPKSQAAP